jgi:hypothetical protein
MGLAGIWSASWLLPPTLKNTLGQQGFALLFSVSLFSVSLFSVSLFSVSLFSVSLFSVSRICPDCDSTGPALRGLVQT